MADNHDVDVYLFLRHDGGARDEMGINILSSLDMYVKVTSMTRG